MGSMGYIIGGAMQGIGGALQQQTIQDAEERRQIALENMRQQNQQTNMRMQAQLNDENAANSDARSDFYDARKTARTATVDETRDKRKFGYDVEMKKIEFTNDLARSKLDSALAMGRDAASARLKAQIERGEIRQIVEGGDGQYYAIRGDGARQATGVRTPVEKPDEQFTLPNRPGVGIGSGATTAPVEKAAPAPAPAKVPPKPAAAKPAPAKPGSRGTVTMSEIDAWAKKRGLSRAEAMRFAESEGLSIQKAAPTKKPATQTVSARDKRWADAYRQNGG